MNVNFLDEEIVIITHNVDGKNYLINCSKKELLKDYWHECNFVPENDALVYLFFYNGSEIKTKPIMTFEDVINFLNN